MEELLQSLFDNKPICALESEWQELYDLSLRVGLLPAVYKRISGLTPENIPSEILTQFRNAYLANLGRNIFLEKELKRILAHFQQNNIPVIPLKGPALAQFLYGDLALRVTSCDLDFLIKLKHISVAEKALEEIGFISCQEGADTFLHDLKLKYAKQLHFIKSIEGSVSLMVDLHHDLRGFFVETSVGNFWQSVRELEMFDRKVLFPTNEQLLAYLSSASLSTFEFVELRYLYDIHMLVSSFKNKLDWQGLALSLKKSNLKASVFFSLKLAQEIFHTEIPEEFLKELRPHALKRYLLSVWINKRNIFYQHQKIASSYLWRYFISSLLYSKDALGCLNIIRRKIFIPMDEVMGMQRQPLSKKSYSLYIKRLLKPISRLMR